MAGMKAADVRVGAAYDWRRPVDGLPWRVRVVELAPRWGRPAVRHETLVADGGPPRWDEAGDPRAGAFAPCRVGNRMWEPLDSFRSGFRRMTA